MVNDQSLSMTRVYHIQLYSFLENLLEKDILASRQDYTIRTSLYVFHEVIVNKI